jgi:chromosome segregation ATPase
VLLALDYEKGRHPRGAFPFSLFCDKLLLVLIIIKRKNMSFRDSVKQIAKDIDDYREDIRSKSRELEDIAEKIHSRAQILDAFADKVYELEEENKNLKSKS